MKRQYIVSILIVSVALVLVTTFTLVTKPAVSVAPIYSYKIVNTYPHATDAFMEGLVYYDGLLYESTGLIGQSTLRRVDLETGTLLQSVSLPGGYFGEGITIVGNRIYQLTWRNGIGLIYNRTSFGLLGNFTYSTEGWGLTFDGNRLIMSDGSSTLHFIDPQTLRSVGELTVRDASPITNLNELEYVKGKIYANVFMTSKIVIIDPSTGHVDYWIDLSSLPGPSHPDVNSVLNGIAYDAAGDRLFVTGKNWPNIYEIQSTTTK